MSCTSTGCSRVSSQFRDRRVRFAPGVQSSKQPINTKIAATLRSSWRSHTWPEFHRTSCGAQVSRTPQTESAGVHGVGQHQLKETRGGQRGGRRARHLHERQIFCRCTDSRGRQTDGGADVRGSRVPQDRAQDHAQSVETSAWLAAPVPISLAKALSAASMGGYGERAHTAGSQACGACPLSGATDVFKTGQTGTTPQNRLDWSEERCLGQLELDRVSGRKEPPDKTGAWDDERLNWMKELSPLLKNGTKDHKLWPFGLVEFGTQFQTRHRAVPNAIFRSRHQHQQAIQKSGFDNEKEGDGEVSRQ